MIPIENRQDERHLMVEQQLIKRGIQSSSVLRAVRKVPRHAFVPREFQAEAYEDHPIYIGSDQTISQPYIVAYMTEVLGLTGQERVLEIGTGSGYQTAILAELAREVYTIEIIPSLARQAQETLRGMGYQVNTRVGDGHQGWLDYAPFDAIIGTAAPASIPSAVLDQLEVGGRMIIPAGHPPNQHLQFIRRVSEGFNSARLIPVAFVPMTGQALASPSNS